MLENSGVLGVFRLLCPHRPVNPAPASAASSDASTLKVVCVAGGLFFLIGMGSIFWRSRSEREGDRGSSVARGSSGRSPSRSVGGSDLSREGSLENRSVVQGIPLLVDFGRSGGPAISPPPGYSPFRQERSRFQSLDSSSSRAVGLPGESSRSPDSVSPSNSAEILMNFEEIPEDNVEVVFDSDNSSSSSSPPE